MPTLLQQKRDKPAHDTLFWRYGGKVALRQGEWKIVKTKENQPWELYNLAKDLGEVNNVAAENGERVMAMAAMAAREEE
jgi:arylsulfatase A-like enzyme